ncbi:MAG: hypothetical protein KGJ13_06515 [Patescibacteria group bacterium]|nr:hypothetical protein [Patescibacteria group bacterium]
MNWTGFANWWKQPFNVNADATSWVLFTGFILVVIYLWTRVLREAGHVVGVS